MLEFMVMKVQEVKNIDMHDIQRLETLFRQVSSNITNLSENLGRIIDSTNSALFLAEDSQIVIGAAIVNLYQKAGYLEARLDDVVIDKSRRGEGLSKLLVKKAISWANEKGVSSVELTSNPQRVEANRLYQSLGFRLRKTNVYKLTL